jgi:hypothetical protein
MLRAKPLKVKCPVKPLGCNIFSNILTHLSGPGAWLVAEWCLSASADGFVDLGTC